ncbi:hypothetical protein PCE1_000789 [Barthelona sp. PCE]
MDVDKRFDQYFVETDSHILQRTAFSKNLCNDIWRFVAHLFFTKTLNGEPSTWEAKVSAWREEYRALKREKIVSRPVEVDGDPLSRKQDTTWGVYWKNEETLNQIRLDLNRFHNNVPEYQGDGYIRQDLEELLLLYTHINEVVGYRQGFNEVIHAFLWMRYQAIAQAKSIDYSGKHAYFFTDDIMDIRADTFAIFKTLMIHLTLFYVTEEEITQQSPALDASTSLKRFEKSTLNRYIFATQDIINERLPSLREHLINMDIEPYYMVSWIRLLLLRQFTNVNDALLVWDVLFAFDCNPMTLLQFVIVEMIVAIKNDLIKMDYAHCMQKLMKYNSIPGIMTVLDQALVHACPDQFTVKRKAPPTPVVVNPKTPQVAPQKKGILNSMRGLFSSKQEKQGVTERDLTLLINTLHVAVEEDNIEIKHEKIQKCIAYLNKLKNEAL